MSPLDARLAAVARPERVAMYRERAERARRLALLHAFDWLPDESQKGLPGTTLCGEVLRNERDEITRDSQPCPRCLALAVK